MQAEKLVSALSYIEPFACAVGLAVMHYRKQLAEYRYLSGFLFLRAVSTSVCLGLFALLRANRLSRHEAYELYFYAYWLSYVVEAALIMGVIYSLYQMAMAPLKGLQQLGMLMFRWAGAISVAVSIAMAFGHRTSTLQFFEAAASQLQQTQSTLALCMLLFVTFAIRPMGLSYQSKIFGVSLGLGILAVTDLASSAWFHSQSMASSAISLVNVLAIVTTVSIWTVYFAIPEPKRHIIVLPTTSPFLRWNQIAQALGDAPGFVAVGGIPPEVFAPSELEIMRRASMKMAVGQNQA